MDHSRTSVRESPVQPSEQQLQPASLAKYKQLKRRLKEVIEENDRLNAKLQQSRHSCALLRKEKDLLLKRIAKHERTVSDDSDTISDLSISSMSSSLSSNLSKSPHARKRSHSHSSHSHSPASTRSHSSLPSMPDSQPSTASLTSSVRMSSSFMSAKASLEQQSHHRHESTTHHRKRRHKTNSHSSAHAHDSVSMLDPPSRHPSVSSSAIASPSRSFIQPPQTFTPSNASIPQPTSSDAYLADQRMHLEQQLRLQQQMQEHSYNQMQQHQERPKMQEQENGNLHHLIKTESSASLYSGSTPLPSISAISTPSRSTAPTSADHNAQQPSTPAPDAAQQPPESTDSKKKRRRTATDLTSRVRKVMNVPLDGQGKPILPLQVNIITIHSLGTIVHERPAYHSERYIYPIGFRTSREYASMIDPEKNVRYTSTILDGGSSPKFQVVAEDQPDKVIQASTSTGAWAIVVRTCNALRNRDISNTVSGPDYFGLSQPTIQKLIQDLPNANLCRGYVWQQFEIMPDKRSSRSYSSTSKSEERSQSAATAPIMPTSTITPRNANSLLSPTQMPSPQNASALSITSGLLASLAEQKSVMGAVNPASAVSISNQTLSNMPLSSGLNMPIPPTKTYPMRFGNAASGTSTSTGNTSSPLPSISPEGAQSSFATPRPSSSLMSPTHFSPNRQHNPQHLTDHSELLADILSDSGMAASMDALAQSRSSPLDAHLLTVKKEESDRQF